MDSVTSTEFNIKVLTHQYTSSSRLCWSLTLFHNTFCLYWHSVINPIVLVIQIWCNWERLLNHAIDLVTKTPLILKGKYHVQRFKELVLWEHYTLAKPGYDVSIAMVISIVFLLIDWVTSSGVHISREKLWLDPVRSPHLLAFEFHPDILSSGCSRSNTQPHQECLPSFPLLRWLTIVCFFWLLVS